MAGKTIEMIHAGKRKKVIFSVTNCICHDQRVLKIAETVSDMGCDVGITGRKYGTCCMGNNVPFRTHRFRMLFRRGFLFYLFFNTRLLFHLAFHKCDILVSNDLDTLLPCFIVSRIKNIPLVYDSHEYFTGIREVRERPLVRFVWKLIERSIFPRLDNVMTVSDMIAERYREEYGVRPVTIMNCARSSEGIIPVTREELGIGNDHLLLVMQGTGINKDRGGEELIRAVSMTDRVSLMVIGSGSSLAEMKNLAGMNCRIKFYDPMPWDLMMRYTRAADIGLSLDHNTSENHEFSLPNKVFDYLSAGIAIIASDIPQVKKIITETGSGIILEKVTPEAISSLLMKLLDNRPSVALMKNNSSLAATRYCWEAESQKVRSLYSGLIPGTGS